MQGEGTLKGQSGETLQRIAKSLVMDGLRGWERQEAKIIDSDPE